jgi:hypothetical protein
LRRKKRFIYKDVVRDIKGHYLYGTNRNFLLIGFPTLFKSARKKRLWWEAALKRKIRPLRTRKIRPKWKWLLQRKKYLNRELDRHWKAEIKAELRRKLGLRKIRIFENKLNWKHKSRKYIMGIKFDDKISNKLRNLKLDGWSKSKRDVIQEVLTKKMAFIVNVRFPQYKEQLLNKWRKPHFGSFVHNRLKKRKSKETWITYLAGRSIKRLIKKMLRKRERKKEQKIMKKEKQEAKRIKKKVANELIEMTMKWRKEKDKKKKRSMRRRWKLEKKIKTRDEKKNVEKEKKKKPKREKKRNVRREKK